MDDVTALIALADEIDRRHMTGAVRASDDIATRIIEALRSSAATITTLQAELSQAKGANYGKTFTVDPRDARIAKLEYTLGCIANPDWSAMTPDDARREAADALA
jgi:hypothetical protein